MFYLKNISLTKKNQQKHLFKIPTVSDRQDVIFFHFPSDMKIASFITLITN